MIINLQTFLAAACLTHSTNICRSNQQSWQVLTWNEFVPWQPSHHTYRVQDALSLIFTSQNNYLKHSLYFTCRERPDGRRCVAPNSWASLYLWRSSWARSSACVAPRSPRSGRGRRADRGWTRLAHGPGTSLALCGNASCCRFHPCGRPCCRWQCRSSVASCSCCWGCRLWPHQDTGCRLCQHQGSGNLLEQLWASLIVDTKRVISDFSKPKGKKWVCIVIVKTHLLSHLQKSLS